MGLFPVPRSACRLFAAVVPAPLLCRSGEDRNPLTVGDFANSLY